MVNLNAASHNGPETTPETGQIDPLNADAGVVLAEHEDLKRDAKDFEEFVYLLSHDLRASVRALADVPKWISEDLTDDGFEISDMLAEYFDIMDTHSRRLNRMLADLLTYSRVGRKQDIREVSLSKALKQAIEDCRPPSSFEVKSDFAVDRIHLGTQDVVVLISAFLSNAIKHNGSEKGRFSISSQSEAGTVVLRLEDNGPGIPEKFHDSVFDVMTTLRPRDEVEGSGMGLAIAKKIVAFYGGTLAFVDVASGSGTGFEIRLPHRER